MKLAITAFFTLLAVTNAHDNRIRHVHKRQVVAAAASSSTPAAVVATSSSPVAVVTASSTAAAVPVATVATASSPLVASSSVAAVPSVTADMTGIPPLAEITMSMPSPATLPVPSSWSAGATPPVSGAPALPTALVYNAADWPTMDVIAPTNSTEVAEWMKELDGFDIPDIDPTVDGTCVNDETAAGNAQANGWWTCGGWTRPTDIVACPDKYTWGVSFDDGPSPSTQLLLNFLETKNVSATFFVVGSRVVERPEILVEEYMTGHEISVHTWSHHPLTSLTNEQVVAELGWTRKAIQTVLGVTPTTMRPPYGDIDDRVRAISLAMGLVPIIWTRTAEGTQFDTNDWQIPGGVDTGVQSFESFEQILGNASLIDTGFIVLQHDLFPQTVDMAVGYTLNAALTYTPKLTLEPIGQCAKIPTSNLYRESNTNTSFPYTNNTSGDTSITAGSTSNSTTTGSSASGAYHEGAPALSGLFVGAGIAAMTFAGLI